MRTLILNLDGNPISITPWLKSFVLVYIKGVATELNFYEKKIKDTKGRHYPIPAVIMLKKLVPYKHFMVALSKKNILLRDHYQCQYCGWQDLPERLNFDHVIPRSRWNKSGSASCWTNLVTCCYPCNQKKGNKLIGEIGFKLLKHPMVPRRQEILYQMALDNEGQIIPEWEPYLSVNKKTP